MHLKAVDPMLCDDGFVSLEVAARRMHTTVEHVSWLANVGVLRWRRSPLGGGIEVEPAIVSSPR